MTLPRSFALTLSIALALVVYAPEAHAGFDRTLLVVGGQVKDVERTEAFAIAEAAIQAARWTLVPLDDKKAAEVLGCATEPGATDPGCMRIVVEAAEADRAVVVTVTNQKQKGRSVRVVSAQVFRRSGELLAASDKFCESCRPEYLKQTVQDAMDDVILAARARLRPAGVSVASKPSGATVWIDGQAVGATPMEFRLYAGKHTVFVEKDGFESQAQEVSLGDGERMEVKFELVSGDGGSDTKIQPPPPTRETPQPQPPRSRVIPWLMIAGGAAVVTTGGVLFALDEDELVDGERIPSHRETATRGIAIGAVGVAAVGVGVYLLLRDGGAPERAPASRSMSPIVGGGASSAWLGVRGSF